MTFLDFIEIGNNDSIVKKDQKGIIIDPLKFELDKLPFDANILKLNELISDSEGECTIYYLSNNKILEIELPWWFKSCNSINSPHPIILKWCENNSVDPDTLLNKKVIPKHTLFSIIKNYMIDGIYHLILDIEYHDLSLLIKYFDDIRQHNKYLPHKITLKFNIESNNELLQKIIILLSNKGYELIYQNDEEIIFQLNLKTLQHHNNKFTKFIQNYTLKEYTYLLDYNNSDAYIPHSNTFINSKQYCRKNNGNAIMKINDKYLCVHGNFLKYQPNSCVSILL